MDIDVLRFRITFFEVGRAPSISFHGEAFSEQLVISCVTQCYYDIAESCFLCRGHFVTPLLGC